MLLSRFSFTALFVGVGLVIASCGDDNNTGIAISEVALASYGHEDALALSAQPSPGNSCGGIYCLWYPTCGEHQHLVITPNNCCGECVGKPRMSPKCFTAVCPAVMCQPGYVRVRLGPNDCCGTCVPDPDVWVTQ